MENNKKIYKTHWHSFLFGFMCALSVVLSILLILTITNHITFKNNSSPKKVSLPDKAESEKMITPNQSLQDIVASLDIDMNEFQACMDEGRFAQTVQENIDSATAAGVQGTPHSFVLIDNALYEIPGAYSEKGMREFFDDLLAGNDPLAEEISAKTDLAPINDDDWIIGDDSARITVIEYSDMDCPYCKAFYQATKNIMTDYPAIRWAFRHMPVDGLHPQAREKAETAECIGSIGGGVKFWEFLDMMFAQN